MALRHSPWQSCGLPLLPSDLGGETGLGLPTTLLSPPALTSGSSSSASPLQLGSLSGLRSFSSRSRVRLRHSPAWATSWCCREERPVVGAQPWDAAVPFELLLGAEEASHSEVDAQLASLALHAKWERNALPGSWRVLPRALPSVGKPCKTSSVGQPEGCPDKPAPMPVLDGAQLNRHPLQTTHERL